ncbi:VIT domain-containing protein [Methylomarinum vadi]|uniref:VIT domain-containing protein n=1 Tax=Methylomarinum vadi TaxID=438855 RepID=UPI00068C0051|nr:VIT domain-containing protein [Methylomarinum vadi]
MTMTCYHALRLLALLPLLLLLGNAEANESNTNKTLSPYFQVAGDDEALPLQETRAQVDIAGVIASVNIRQVYQNSGNDPIEAVYVFPGSTRAAVYAMTMTIGERRVTAKIKERQAAKAAYQQAKKAGKRASLLEQQRPNVFQMKVANIMPGDRVVVELAYSELIVPEQGVYEFVYPAVVGPRYSELPVYGASDSDQWIANPYLHQGEKAPYAFGVEVSLAAGLPIQSIMSPSHDVTVAYDDHGAAKIGLKSAGADNGNRDYVLRYRLRGEEIETGLLLHRGETENFFLLLAQPPERVVNAAIPPREYIFVVDVSGSMHGFPLDIGKKLMVELLSRLRPTDGFNILFFSGGSSLLAERPLPATENNIEKAIEMMESQRGGGGTRLLPALQRAMRQPAASGVSRSFVVVTDGYIAVETDVFDYVKRNLNNANFFAFGIGSGVNRFLIEGLARKAGAANPSSSRRRTKRCRPRNVSATISKLRC